jgi:hypothetical protein
LHLSASPITITFRPQLTPSEIARTPCERRGGSLPAHKIWFKSLISYLMNWCVMWYCNISMYLCHAVRCNISRYRIEDYYYKLQPWTDAELFGCNQFRWERWLRYCHWHEIWCKETLKFCLLLRWTPWMGAHKLTCTYTLPRTSP